MKTKMILMALILSFIIIFPVIAQEELLTARETGNENRQKITFSGEIIGMYTLGGLAEDEQAIIINSEPIPSGIYDDDTNGKNGYYTAINLNVLYNPFSYVDVYAKLQAKSRPGSPYVPLQLESTDAEAFSLSLDSVYGRINVIDAFSLNIPLDVLLKAGKFDTTPSSFQKVTRYGAEDVMSRLRTKNTYAFQIAAAYQLPFAESIGLSFTTHQKFNEAITPLYDSDGSLAKHGNPSLEEKYDIPLHFVLDFLKIATPLGPVSAEMIYAYNAENIFSGSSFGFDAGWDISIPGIDNMVIPFGFGAAVYEKNIDPFAKVALNRKNDNYLNILHENDANTISFRRAVRTGMGLGVRFYPINALEIKFNAGYSWSQVAHIYRDTLTINSASFDLLVTYDSKFFLGGGMYLGTLNEIEWKTKSDADSSYENGYSHIFKPMDNLGFEIFGGMLFGKSRFLIGYNCNKGLSMNNAIESIPEAQVIYRQKETGISDGLFQSGGIFTKLVVSW